MTPETAPDDESTPSLPAPSEHTADTRAADREPIRTDANTAVAKPAHAEPSTPPPDSDAPCCEGYPPFLGEARHLTEAELGASLAKTLSHWDRESDLWMFGYGSLIWNPGMPALDSVRARIHGYHRGLYLWSRINRGSPDVPGLVLALDRGGSCPGMAFKIEGKGAMPHLESLWKREMAMGSYRPAWLDCTLCDGRRVKALSFVMRREALTYTGKLDDATVRHVFRSASGRYGTTHDYVTRTVAALRECGMPDLALEDLLRRCS